MDRLGEVQDTLFYIREELRHLQDENHSLKNKISGLEDALELKGRVIWKKPSYWTIDGESEDGPFSKNAMIQIGN